MEIRIYTTGDSFLVKNAVRRLATYAFEDRAEGLVPLEPLPEGSDLEALTPRLQDVVEVARWVGFLRWAKAHDPNGFARLQKR